ncbi:UNVERIFIED_CONTAM: hypothetical protein GTU68_013208 [Idotea baltica]|nr:hypothetical protein [Idotea baltica]
MQLQSLKQRFGLIGNAENFNNALGVAVRVAPTNLTVLISGASGVGKEVFSKIMHKLSPRKHNNFIAVNCGAIPEGTIDSELFGHEKGAFTGASDSRKGYFEHVNGGTIFLDEIGEMPMGTQSRLLRVLESGEFIKVGSSKVQRTDVRVVAATNVDLVQAVANGKFREDLYYRLNTVPIKVPPLNERKEDIYLLFRKFSVDFAEKQRSQTIVLNDEAKKLLTTYPWPGNIRELKNIAEQISVLANDPEITAEILMSYLPRENFASNLPVLLRGKGNNTDDFSEREIMYKLLFDMRNDINDLKGFVLKMAESGSIPADLDSNEIFKKIPSETEILSRGAALSNIYDEQNLPIVINDGSGLHFEQEESAELVEESLSIADKEKELIEKALKKHRGRRKDAAEDLGISERTLYRKIKEYELSV